MLKVISLFSGIGAGEEALRKLGAEFEIVNFSECNKSSIEIYCAMNGVDETRNLGTIQEVSEETINNLPKDIDILFASVPVIAGPMISEQGMKNLALSKPLDIVKATNPKYIVMDNVKACLNDGFFKGNSYQIFKIELMNLGYKIESVMLSADDFGLPTEITRVYYIAIREDINEPIILPNKTMNIRFRGSYYKGQIITDEYLEPLTTEIKEKYKVKIKVNDNTDRRLYNTAHITYSNPIDIQLVKQDGIYRRLTHREYMRFAGFTENSIDKALEINDTHDIYRMVSVCSIVNMMEAVLRSILENMIEE